MTTPAHQTPGLIDRLVYGAPSSSPRRIMSADSDIYGWLYFTSSPTANSLLGLNKVAPASGAIDNIFTAITSNETATYNNFWIRQGHVFSIVDTYKAGNYETTYLNEWDMEGNLLNQTELGKSFSDSFYYNMVAYDPSTDTIYGFSTNDDVSEVYFVKAPGSNPAEMTRISTCTALEAPNSMTFNTSTGQLIGVLFTGQIVEINTLTGEQYPLANIPYPGYNTGFCYSPLDGGYIYNRVSTSGSSIQLLDPTTFAVKDEVALPYIYQFVTFQCMDSEKVNESAPGSVENLAASFSKGALSGKVTFTLPTATLGGVPMLGNVVWQLDVDNKPYRKGTAAAGSDVKVDVTDLTEGIHVFRVRTSLGSEKGQYESVSMYIGHDTPCAPANVELSSATISWQPVTEGVNAGYVNAAEVTYNVRLNDTLIASGISDTSCPTGLKADTDLTNYVAKVEAVYNGKVSEPALSNDIIFGNPLPLPVKLAPTETQSRLFTTADSNNDGNCFYYTTVTYAGAPIGTFTYNTRDRKAADDWLFLPATTFTDAEAVYHFSMNVFGDGASDAGSYEVKIGLQPTAEAMTTSMIGQTDATTAAPSSSPAVVATSVEAYFRIPNADTYYIGIHATSSTKSSRFYLRNFTVEKSAYDADAPAPVADLKAVAAEGGVLSANVSFTFPTQSYRGETLAADAALTAKVSCLDKSVTLNGHPGEAVSTQIATAQGDNTIAVAVSQGSLESITATTTVYTGLDLAGNVRNLKATADADNLGATLTWKGPDTGANGGWNNPTEGNTYTLYQYTSAGWKDAGVIGTDVYTCHVAVPTASALNLYNYAVKVTNAVGEAPGAESTAVMLGTPYQMPQTESFADDTVDLAPVVNLTSESKLEIGLPSVLTGNISLNSPDKAHALVAYKKNQACNFNFALPEFSTVNLTNPSVILDIYGGGCEKFAVKASAYGIEPVEVASYVIKDFSKKGRTEITVNLPEQFRDKPWVQISISGYCKKAARTQAFVLFGYSYKNLVDHDLAVESIQASPVVQIGDELSATAMIVNEGTKPCTFSGGTWTVKDSEGSVVASVNAAPSSTEMQPGDSHTADIVFVPGADTPSELVLSFALAEDDDLNANNSRTFDVKIVQGMASVVTDLHASEISFDKVVLEWTAPKRGTTVESFEDCTPFEVSATTIGAFKNVDVDGKPVYIFQNGSVIPGAQQPAGFTVWDSKQLDEMLGVSGAFPAPDGNRFIVAFGPSDESEADDWLISPKVDGNSEMSFLMRPITYNYGAETVEILYSSTDDDIDSFKLLQEVKTEGKPGESIEWKQYSFTLPADARYFAIHYKSAGVFGIMIDRIAYAPEGSSLTVTGYDILRDGVIIEGNAPCQGDMYVDSTVAESTDYTYNILPRLSDGKSGLNSNTLHLHTTAVEGIASDHGAIGATRGAIVLKGLEGESYSVWSTSGICAAQGVAGSSDFRIRLEEGVYIVKAGAITARISVR